VNPSPPPGSEAAPTGGWPTLDSVWRLAIPFGLFAFLQWTVIQPADFWWHLRVGQILVQTGILPSVDLFSFTRAGEPWLNQSWLMEVALYGIHRAGGLPLILFLHAVTVGAGYVLLLRTTRSHYGLHAGSLAVLVAALVGSSNWGVRPQSISFLAFGALVFLIEAHRHGRRRALWWALPLMALWVNAHGGFVFGIGALGFYLIGRVWEFARAGSPATQRSEILELVAIVAGCVAALGLNPAGPVGIVRYVLGFLASDMTRGLAEEFRPLSIRDSDGLFFFASWLLLLVLMLRAGFRPRVDQVLSLLGFSLLTLYARRVAPWYGFLLAPVLAAALQAPLARRFRSGAEGNRRRNAVYLGFVGLLVIGTLPWLRPWVPGPGGTRALAHPETPFAAVGRLCRDAGNDARVYQDMAFASYQIWACPRLPVFQDARNELYPEEQWRDYLHVHHARFDWEEVLDRYAVSHLLLSLARQESAVEAATRAEGWREIHRDETAVVFERAR
jgi:hypothetical protein